MSITIDVLRRTNKLVIMIDNENVQMFKEMVNRALNCWDKAPAELKSFADRLNKGHELQDYHNISQPKPRPDQ